MRLGLRPTASARFIVAYMAKSKAEEMPPGLNIASAVSTSPLGTITSAAGAEAFRAGIGTGVGRALDRLAQYYIKLAENTFPVIEVDAGREIDVVITRGVRIDTPMTAEGAAPAAAATPPTGLARAVATDQGGSDEQD